jgi:putative membrane protein
MKRLSYLVLAMSGFLAMQSCNSNQSATSSGAASTDTPTSNLANTNPADTAVTDKDEFPLKAASGGMMEVQLGQLAQKNGQSQRVKNFGAMMVKDHSKANTELKAIAESKNISLPTTLIPEHQEHVTMLQKVTGAEFDKQYMEMMTKDHQEDIDEFDKASKSSADADIKAFATKTLPVLRVHLDSAQAINNSLKK